MDDSESVVGLSLAEVAFFMLFVMMLFAMVGRTQVRDVVDVEKKLDVAEKELESSRAALAALAEENERLRAEMNAPGLPTCRDTLNLPDRYLFSAVVLGPDSFKIASLQEPVSLRELRSAFASELNEAQGAGCVYAVEYFFDGDLTAAELDGGESRLRQDFYLQPRGEYPEQ